MVDRQRPIEETMMQTGSPQASAIAGPSGPVATRRIALLAALAVCTLVFALTAAARASAAEEFEPGFEFFNVTTTDSQAGGHPDVTIDFQTKGVPLFGGGCGVDCPTPRVIRVHWPAGFIGNPHVAPKCSLSEFNEARCSADAQVGTFALRFEGIGLFTAVYNMQTRPDQAGLLGFQAPFLGFPIFFEISARTDGDYGLEVNTSPMTRIGSPEFKTILWGVPASPEHTPYRFETPMSGVGACYEGIFPPEIKGCPPGILSFVSATYAEPTFPERPFLQNPTVCSGDLTVKADVEYFGGLEGHGTSTLPGMNGCQQASFNPSLVAKPTTSRTDSASGLDTDVHVPQTQSPITPSPSETKGTVIKLPPGFTINPNAADGKVACPETLSAIGTLLGASCPEYSKVATMSLDISALPGPIPGAIYLLEPRPGNPYRILLTADGFATHVKLPGSVRPDPKTGQLSFVFDELPQAPLQDFSIHVFGSERGLFATPAKCSSSTDPAVVEGEFVPWNDQLTTRHTTSFMTFDGGPNGSACPAAQRPFGPQLGAGSESNTAGAHSPFSLTLTRQDGEQNLVGFGITTAPGFSATLKGVPYCSEGAIAKIMSSGYLGVTERESSACPAASQIGTALGGAGAGNHPLDVGGKVYLAGPYKGAPLSLLVVLPAVSGPYDFGNVAVRAALHVDPATAQVTTVSDPFPQILEGVPLRTRSIRIDLNRRGFTLNPTNCNPFSVDALVNGSEGATASPSALYQVANCAGLGFEPKLALQLHGSMKHAGHPALRAVLTAPESEANIGRTIVTMPRSEFVANENFRNVCSRVQYGAGQCPTGSVYGYARALTPLLGDPLEGPVYLRTSGKGLPDLVADLKGQIEIEVVGHIDSVNGRLRASFLSLPDAPISKFVLDMQGGSKSLLANSEPLCSHAQKAQVKMRGQNGATLKRMTAVQTACGKRSKRRHARHARPGVR
jgi:hypothetical protein